MSDEHTIMKAANYSIESLKQIRKVLTTTASKSHPIAWSIGGIQLVLVAHLLKVSNEVFNTQTEEEPNAKTDILKIKEEFNKLVDNMIEGNQNV